jgi:hypothetical protein
MSPSRWPEDPGPAFSAEALSDVVQPHLIASDLATSEQGADELKGVPNEWRTVRR